MALITGQSEFYTDKKVWFYHLENKTLDFKVTIWNFLFLDALASLEEPIVTSDGNLFKNRPRASTSEYKQPPINLRLFQTL